MLRRVIRRSAKREEEQKLKRQEAQLLRREAELLRERVEELRYESEKICRCGGSKSQVEQLEKEADQKEQQAGQLEQQADALEQEAIQLGREEDHPGGRNGGPSAEPPDARAWRGTSALLALRSPQTTVAADKSCLSTCSSSRSEAGSDEGCELGDAAQQQDFLLVNLFFCVHLAIRPCSLFQCMIQKKGKVALSTTNRSGTATNHKIDS